MSPRLNLTDAPFFAPPPHPERRGPMTAAALSALRGIGDREARALSVWGDDADDRAGARVTASGLASGGAGVGWRPAPGSAVSFVLPDGRREDGRVAELGPREATVQVDVGTYRFVLYDRLLPYTPSRASIRAALGGDLACNNAPDLRETRALIPLAGSTAPPGSPGDYVATLAYRAGLHPTEDEVCAYVEARYPGAQIVDADDRFPGKLGLVLHFPYGPAAPGGESVRQAELALDDPARQLHCPECGEGPSLRHTDRGFSCVNDHHWRERSEPLVNKLAVLTAANPAYRFVLDEDGTHFGVTCADGAPLFVAQRTGGGAGGAGGGGGSLVLTASLLPGGVPAVASFDGAGNVIFEGPAGQLVVAPTSWLTRSAAAAAAVEDEGGDGGAAADAATDEGGGGDACYWQLDVTFGEGEDVEQIDKLLDDAIGMPHAMTRDGDRVSYHFEFDGPDEARAAMDAVLAVQPQVDGLEVSLSGRDAGGSPLAPGSSGSPDLLGADPEGTVLETLGGPGLAVAVRQAKAEAEACDVELVRSVQAVYDEAGEPNPDAVEFLRVIAILKTAAKPTDPRLLAIWEEGFREGQDDAYLSGAGLPPAGAAGAAGAPAAPYPQAQPQRPAAPAPSGAGSGRPSPYTPGSAEAQQLAQSLLFAYQRLPAAQKDIADLVRRYVKQVPGLQGDEPIEQILPAAVAIAYRENPAHLEKLRSKYAPEQAAVGTEHGPGTLGRIWNRLRNEVTPDEHGAGNWANRLFAPGSQQLLQRMRDVEHAQPGVVPQLESRPWRPQPPAPGPGLRSAPVSPLPTAAPTPRPQVSPRDPTYTGLPAGRLTPAQQRRQQQERAPTQSGRWFEEPAMQTGASLQATAALGRVPYQGDIGIRFAIDRVSVEGEGGAGGTGGRGGGTGGRGGRSRYLVFDVTWDPGAPARAATTDPTALRYLIVNFLKAEATHAIDRYGLDFGRMRGRPVVFALDPEAGVATARMRVRD